MLRNKDIPDHRGNCKLRQTIGRQLQWGLSCVTLKLETSHCSFTVLTGKYKAHIHNRKKLPSCSCTFQVKTGQGQNLL